MSHPNIGILRGRNYPIMHALARESILVDLGYEVGGLRVARQEAESHCMTVYEVTSRNSQIVWNSPVYVIHRKLPEESARMMRLVLLLGVSPAS